MSDASSTTTSTSKTTSKTDSKSDTKSETKSEAKSESTSSDSAGSETTTSTSSKSGGGGSRPISYFSSVSTDDYRSGWDSVFGGGQAKSGKSTTAKSRRSTPRKKQASLPVAIELTDADLDEEARRVLEEAFRRKAKAKRLNYERLSRKASPSWHLRCEFPG